MLKEDKNIIISIEQANKYTEYLQMKTVIMAPIDNSQLKNKKDDPLKYLLKIEDYVIFYC